MMKLYIYRGSGGHATLFNDHVCIAPTKSRAAFIISRKINQDFNYDIIKDHLMAFDLEEGYKDTYI